MPFGSLGGVEIFGGVGIDTIVAEPCGQQDMPPGLEQVGDGEKVAITAEQEAWRLAALASGQAIEYGGHNAGNAAAAVGEIISKTERVRITAPCTTDPNDFWKLHIAKDLQITDGLVPNPGYSHSASLVVRRRNTDGTPANRIICSARRKITLGSTLGSDIISERLTGADAALLCSPKDQEVIENFTGFGDNVGLLGLALGSSDFTNPDTCAVAMRALKQRRANSPDATTIFAANDIEIRQFYGSSEKTHPYTIALRLSRDLGKGCLVLVTMGEEGLAAAYNGNLHHQTAQTIPAEQVKDTTGAGDATLGGFFAKMAEGASVPESLATAALLGGVAVQSLGGHNWLTTYRSMSASLN